jgi:class 3 adenylate cyclase
VNRLRNKLVLAFTLLVVGSAALMLSVVWRTASNDFYTDLREDVDRAYGPIDLMQKPLFDAMVNQAAALADDPSIQEARFRRDVGNLEALLVDAHASADVVCLADFNGNVLVQIKRVPNGEHKLEVLPTLVDGKPTGPAISVKENAVVAAVLRDGTPVRTYAPYGDGALYACVGYPLSRGNATDGVVLVGRRVDDQFCRTVVGHLHLNPPIVFAITKGSVLGSWNARQDRPSEQAADMTAALATWTPPTVTMQTKSHPFRLRIGHDDYLALAYPIWDTLTKQPAGWVFIVEPLNKLYELVHNLALAILLTGVAGLLVALLVSAYLSTRITQPIEQLSEKMRLVGEGDLAQHAEVVGQDEVAHLAQTFNDMTDGLRKKELLKRYVPMSARDLIESNTDGRIVLGGRRIRATVMFSDIRGFTTLSERLDPAEVVKALNEYLEAMIEVIHKHNGDINDYIGDAILAVFHEDEHPHTSALHAVKCAFDMQSALDMLHQRSGNPNVQGLRMGIGIHTGVLVEGNMGTADRLKHAVIGDTVNSASRIQDRSRDGKYSCILMSTESYEDVKDFIKAEFFGNEHLKGKAEPVPIWEAVELLPSALSR